MAEKLDEYPRNLHKALDDYAERFGDAFPMYQLGRWCPERVIELVEECMSKNKDVYQLGYLDADDCDICY